MDGFQRMLLGSVENLGPSLPAFAKQNFSQNVPTAKAIFFAAKSLKENLAVQSYLFTPRRFGRANRWEQHQFKDVDIALMVEKTVGVVTHTFPYVIRSADQKSLSELQEICEWIKKIDGDNVPEFVEYSKLVKIPGLGKTRFWSRCQRDPDFFRSRFGTCSLVMASDFYVEQMNVFGQRPILSVGSSSVSLSFNRLAVEPSVAGKFIQSFVAQIR